MSKLEFLITVTADTPEEESDIAKKIAAAFIAEGVRSVTAIADSEHINYVDGEVCNVTEIHQIFRMHPRSETDAFVVAHTPK